MSDTTAQAGGGFARANWVPLSLAAISYSAISLVVPFLLGAAGGGAVAAIVMSAPIVLGLSVLVIGVRVGVLFDWEPFDDDEADTPAD